MERRGHRRWGGSCRDMGAVGWVLAVTEVSMGVYSGDMQRQDVARHTEAMESEAEISEKGPGGHVQRREMMTGKWIRVSSIGASVCD